MRPGCSELFPVYCFLRMANRANRRSLAICGWADKVDSRPRRFAADKHNPSLIGQIFSEYVPAIRAIKSDTAATIKTDHTNKSSLARHGRKRPLTEAALLVVEIVQSAFQIGNKGL
jgi:hypothetical protein